MKQTAIYQRKRAHHSQWFNKWIQSPMWLAGFGMGCLVAVLLYVANSIWGELHPGSAWGISYGIFAAILFTGVMAYSIRRRMMRVRALPRSWYYLQFHVYGGALFLLFMFMHSNFSYPEGIITWWLWILSIWIVVSGLIGIVLQKWIPTMLNTGLSIEVHYDRIPELVEASRDKAEKLVASSSKPIQDFYKKHLASSMAIPQPRLMYYLDAASNIQSRTRLFDHVRSYLSDREQLQFDELMAIYKTKLEMDAHCTLQRGLRWWIYAHAPLSFLLVVLLVAHILSVVYY